jgi:hypothetical protein
VFTIEFAISFFDYGGVEPGKESMHGCCVFTIEFAISFFDYGGVEPGKESMHGSGFLIITGI